MSGNFQQIATLSLGANLSSAVVDFDTYAFNQNPFTLLISGIWSKTASASGLTMVVYDGLGSSDQPDKYSVGFPIVLGGSSVPTYNTNGTAYTLSIPTLNSSSPVVAADSVQFVTYYMSRWARIVFSNSDGLNPCKVDIKANIP